MPSESIQISVFTYVKRHEDIFFWGGGGMALEMDVHYPDRGDNFTGIYASKPTKLYTLNMCSLLYVTHIVITNIKFIEKNSFLFKKY
jgi:hypothetical protein